MVLATLYMKPEKRTEYLSAITPETKAAVESWQKTDPEGYAELSHALQTMAVDMSPSTEALKGTGIPTGKGSWILPQDGKLGWMSGTSGFPR